MAQHKSTATLTVDQSSQSSGESARQHLYLALSLHQPLSSPLRVALGAFEQILFGRGRTRAADQTSEGVGPERVRRLEIKIDDPWMSSRHAKLTRVLGRWMLEDEDSKNGSFVNGAQQKRSLLGDGDVVELGRTFFLYREGDADEGEPGPAVVDGINLGAPAPGLATLVPTLARELARLAQLAPSPVSVVLRGESGTGKEVVARAIHALSGRTGGFVAVNCGALPDNLVETELFGYRKGAFSGALEDRPGLIRAAHAGTLFLDEIGDLPPSSQAAFLRALQEREVTPVGGTKPVHVDMRLVAATHRDLDLLAEEERFRPDLLNRISGFKLELLPLRHRRGDLGLLVAALLRRLVPDRAEQVKMQPKVGRALFQYDWPGNVRELEKCLGTAVMLATGRAIEIEDLPEPLQVAARGGAPRAGEDEDVRRKEEIVALLREHRGNIAAVARSLGKARMQVQRWIKRYRIEPESYRR